MSAKHGNVQSVVQRSEDHQSQRQATFETEARAEDVHHDRTISNGPTEALKPDLGNNKFILIPEAKHRQLMTSGSSEEMASINRDVMQSIHQPEQREMLESYHLAQTKFRDGDANMAEYREAMQDFSVLRDRQGERARPQQRAVTKERRSDDGEARTNETAMTDAAVIDMLPASQKENAHKLLQLLRAHGDDVVSWTRNGGVSIHGEHLRGMNIADLVNDVLQSSPSSTRTMPQRENFLTALAYASVPEVLIKKNTALELYREIKTDFNNDDLDDDDTEVSSKTSRGREGYSASTKSKTRKRRVERKEFIDWTAPL